MSASGDGTPAANLPNLRESDSNIVVLIAMVIQATMNALEKQDHAISTMRDAIRQHAKALGEHGVGLEEAMTRLSEQEGSVEQLKRNMEQVLQVTNEIDEHLRDLKGGQNG